MLGNEIKKNLYFKYGVSLLVALVISLFFSHTIFNDIFASPAKEARLVITATAERNIKSGGIRYKDCPNSSGWRGSTL